MWIALYLGEREQLNLLLPVFLITSIFLLAPNLLLLVLYLLHCLYQVTFFIAPFHSSWNWRIRSPNFLLGIEGSNHQLYGDGKLGSVLADKQKEHTDSRIGFLEVARSFEYSSRLLPYWDFESYVFYVVLNIYSSNRMSCTIFKFYTCIIPLDSRLNFETSEENLDYATNPTLYLLSVETYFVSSCFNSGTIELISHEFIPLPIHSKQKHPIS